MYLKTKNLVQKYNLMAEPERLRFELAAIDDFYLWSRITWVRFTYVYANNADNKRLGRVGQSTGTRYGTRNLDLIPTSKKPKHRNTSTRTIRYFDTGRSKIRDASGRYTKNNGQAINGSWRSFRPGLVAVVTGIWSFERGKFVSDFADFNIKNQPVG